MKSIMLSVQPQWVEKILKGEQTILIAKSTPKEVPFKVYVYCTKGNTTLYRTLNKGYSTIGRKIKGEIRAFFSDNREVVLPQLNGKVVAEFICKNVNLYVPMQENYFIGNSDFFATCLTDEEINNYGKGKDIYGCHITDLKIYDEPRELDNFTGVCKTSKRCGESKICSSSQKCLYDNLTKPPATWMYVVRKC